MLCVPAGGSAGTSGLPLVRRHHAGGLSHQRTVDTEGGLSASYKTAWHCPDCRKLVLDVTPPPRPQWEEPAEETPGSEETEEQAQ